MLVVLGISKACSTYSFKFQPLKHQIGLDEIFFVGVAIPWNTIIEGNFPIAI